MDSGATRPETGEERALLVEAVRGLASARDFRELTSIADRDHAFSWPLWEALCQSELPGLDVPPEYGGQGGTCLDVAHTYAALAEHGIAATTALFTFSGFGAHVLLRLDEAHPLRQLLPGIASGEVRSSLGLTEPAGGTALARMRTSLVRDASDFRLRGSKVYTTLARESTHIVFGALVDGPGSWRERFALAVVSADAPGLTMQRLEIDALRSCPTYEVFIDDVVVQGDSVILPPDGFSVLTSVLNQERLAVASQSLGLARRALQLALEHAERREIGDVKLAEKQVVAHRLVECWESTEAARELVFAAARGVDDGDESGVLPTMAQRAAAAAAHAASDLAVQLHGGGGLQRGEEVNRLWRDTRLHLIGPVAREEAADYLFRHMRATFR